MKVQVGVKSDPIESRYTFDWLFDLMADFHLRHMQLGSFYAMYELEDSWFVSLARRAERKGIQISSVFTSHRELSGFMSGDPSMEAATRRSWEKLLRIASAVGARSAGSSAGPLMRDTPQAREEGIRCYVRHMKELARMARGHGLRALTVEPMSSIFEFPSTAEDIRLLDAELDAFRGSDPDSMAPLYYCADISHGVADASRSVVADNWRMFELEIPHMWELHFKNTDSIFNSTFGFSREEQKRGIVDLSRLKGLIEANAERFPGKQLVGYLELPGPKVGRDYTDNQLGKMLRESLQELVAVFGA
jgi:ribulose-phosphate 3-epimerase